jgi:hypothetical protein
VLDQDHSCRAAVMRVVLLTALNERKPCSTETTSYCEARRRLPLKVIVRLVQETAERIEAGASDDWLWKGRRASLVDGTTASMLDTPENQRAFPQANTQGIGLGSPIGLRCLSRDRAGSTGWVRGVGGGGCYGRPPRPHAAG